MLQLLFLMLLLSSVARTVVAQSVASVTIDASAPVFQIDGRLWGSNLTNASQTEDRTIYNTAFVDAARQMGIQVIRWPGGNNADAYDWKRDKMIRPGRRIPWAKGISLPEIAAFARSIGAELSITVNFGTMTAQDAADLVEYCNGPVTTPWGARRAADGFPEPLNVRFFEIGNEINQPHQWYNSWTAEHPLTYFFGGSEERRGSYQASENVDPVGRKGDFFRVLSDTTRVYTLRFPPVQNVRVFWSASEEDARNGHFEEWARVSNLTGQPPDARVFVLDSLAGELRFGDGIHGAAPPPQSYFLVEYTTYGHEGFVAFARAMRQAASSVPIRIGSVMLPFRDGIPIVPEDSMRLILNEIDFIISHKYDAPFPVDTYAQRRQIAYQRTRYSDLDRLNEYMQSIGIDKTIGIGITEWNIFLNEQYWWINRTLEGAVIAGEYLIRLLNAQPDLPVWIAHQFAMGGTWLSLYNNWTSFSIGPMGYVFEGFKKWKGMYRLPVEVHSPLQRAYDVDLPLIRAAAALNTSGDTLRIALINNAETDTVALTLNLENFTYRRGIAYRLEGTSPEAHNEQYPYEVVLVPKTLGAHEADELFLSPHSVVFLELIGKRVASSAEGQADRDRKVGLYPPYPNPSRGYTVIRYTLPTAQWVKLDVYDSAGRNLEALVHQRQAAGTHAVVWDGRGRTSGVYLLRLQTGSGIWTETFIHIR